MKSAWWFLFHPRTAREVMFVQQNMLQLAYSERDRFRAALEQEVASFLEDRNLILIREEQRVFGLRQALAGISTYLDRPTVIRSARNGAVLCSVKDVRVLIHEAAAALEADDLERAG